MLRTPRLAWGKAGVGLWSQNRVIEAGAGRTQDDRPIAAYKGTTDSAVAWIPVGFSLHHWGDMEWQVEPKFTYNHGFVGPGIQQSWELECKASTLRQREASSKRFNQPVGRGYILEAMEDPRTPAQHTV